MSRGPGKLQRETLRLLAEKDKWLDHFTLACKIFYPEDAYGHFRPTKSQYVSLLRATRKLEAAGMVVRRHSKGHYKEPWYIEVKLKK